MASDNSNESLLKIDQRNSIALVMLNSETTQNALNGAMVDELSRIFASLQIDTNARAVILTGAGNAFSVGTSVEELMALTPEQGRSLAQKRQALMNLIENLGKPVIGAINGLAYGSGCELALACTWRIASPEAEFAFPEPSLGLMPGVGGLTRLAKVIGKPRALEMILAGNPINASEAMRIGVVNRIVHDTEVLLPFCEELGCQLSRQAPLAIKYALDAVNYGCEMALADGMRLESALFGLCFATKDGEEGAKAFLEKRSPIFRGQ